MNKKAMIAMSGGVDSSVAAYLIKKQGYEASGVTLKLFTNDDAQIKCEKTCCSLSDIEDARSVANSLDMPYFVYNFTSKFKEGVIDRFIDSYMTGATPNPCIDCNRFIKFEHLIHRAKELGFDYVVTGHYCMIEKDEQAGRYLLKKSVDDTKDQSYVLYSLTQEQLSMTLFPLGGMNKTQVREVAESLDFINARKRDSQDICFIPDGDYAKFIESYTNQSFPEGDFVRYSGEVIGKHKGLIRYTIGQRKGLGISHSEPLFVCDILPQQNRVILGTQDELYRDTLTASQINLIPFDKIDGELKVKAKIRYRHVEEPATVTQIGEDKIKVVFDNPQRAITKGQSVVLYDGDYVIGGGIID